MSSCSLCSIAAHEVEADIFFEDEKTIALLDIDWAAKGHSLIVWKEHVLNMSDLSQSDFAHFAEVCRRVEAKLLQVLAFDRSIVLKSGGLEPHFHFHIYPVMSDISWDAIRTMFEKKVQFEPKENERKALLTALRNL